MKVTILKIKLGDIDVLNTTRIVTINDLDHKIN